MRAETDAGRTWYAPSDLHQWRLRLRTLRCGGLLLIALVLILTELHFDWVEQLLGGYLTTTNAVRPKSGAVWEQSNQVDAARETLGQFSILRQNTQLETRRATSLGQFLGSMGAQTSAMTSAAHFIELLLKLPPAISHQVISPYLLLAKLSEGRWTRTFFELQDNRMAVYLLDSQNQVLDRLHLGSDLLAMIKKGDIVVSTQLGRMAAFAGRVYPADRFFQALNSLSPGDQAAVVAHPEDLLLIINRIHRVGISGQRQADVVEVGFEVQDADGPKVVFTQGRADVVERLQLMLERLEPDTTAGRPDAGGAAP